MNGTAVVVQVDPGARIPELAHESVAAVPPPLRTLEWQYVPVGRVKSVEVVEPVT